MQYTVSLTSQGQISIPAPIRRELELNRHRKVLVTAVKNKIIVEPVDDILSLRGSFKTAKRISDEKIREEFIKYLAKGRA